MVKIVALQAEHHESGLGIGHASPRLSWRFEGAKQDKSWTQVSYDISITRPSSNGTQSEPQVYKVDSAESVLVPWPGKPLASREAAEVKVRVKGSDGSTTDWEEIIVEAGLLVKEAWEGKMVGAPKRMVDEAKRPIRVWKRFEVADFTKARLYATAHGLYELTLNGQRVGDQVLAPGWQSYNYHLNYQTFDVTPLLQRGSNFLCAYVGEGWYATRLGRPGERNLWGDQLGVLAQLDLDERTALATDETWTWTDGGILTSEIYDGEVADSRLIDEDWWKEGDLKGNKVEVMPFPKPELVSSDAPPVRRIMEVKPKEVITTPSGKTILDFGQNLVGWVRVKKDLMGEGDVVFRYAEVLEHGELGVRPLRTAKATDVLKLGGKTKGWEPKFTFHGFRYAEITGCPVDLSSFTAIVISSDLRRTGHFSCSHPSLNQLHSNVVWSMMGNFVSVPTDCPQRDERLGWTGDIQVFAPTASYLFDTSGFLAGWLKDVYVEQKQFHGVPPEVVPYVSMNKRPAPRPMGIWADVVALTPWDLYTAFGDTNVLADQFDSMALWLDEGVPRRETGLWSHEATQYGDWLDPRAPPQFPAHGQTDPHFTTDAYLVYVTGLTARIAKLLGKSAEAKRFGNEYDKLLKEFRAEYVSPKGRLTSDSQTAIALALRFGLVEGEQRKHAGERLEHLIRWDGFRISTGFAGTPIILDALADIDKLHLAYRMLQEGHNPSWLYPVSMGATTIWERWDSMLPDGSINPGQMTSFNHYALGAVAAFLHGTVGGLSPLEPGWKKALIAPRPGGTVRSAKTSFDSPYGLYEVEWEVTSGKLKVKAKVPPNASAKVVLGSQEGVKREDVEEEVGSGSYAWEVDWKEDGRWPPTILPGPSSIQLEDKFVE